MIGRREPYTALGISRVPCARCGKPSVHQWNACAINNRFVGICTDCDIALNKMVLRFMRIAGWRKLIARYARRVRAIA